MEFVLKPDTYSCFPVALWEQHKANKTELPCQLMCVKSPERFWLRFFFEKDMDESKDIRDFMDVVFEMIDSNGNIRPPKKFPVDPSHLVMGLPVSVYLASDNAFYRGIALKVEADRCRCYLVDFGTEDWFELSDVNYLPTPLIDIECIAIECKLANTTPPPDTAPDYPEDCSTKMMSLSNSDDFEKFRDKPLMCRVLEVFKPQPVEFDSGWRFHRNIFTRLEVELRMPESEYPMARQPNGFAHLLASHNLCRLGQVNMLNTPTPPLNGGPFAEIGKKSTVSKGGQFIAEDTNKKLNKGRNGRGRGTKSNLTDKQCPPLPFDDEDD